MDNNPSSRKHFQLLCEILQQQLNDLKSEDKPALLDTDQVKDTLREIYDAVHRLGLETYAKEQPTDIPVIPQAEMTMSDEPVAIAPPEHDENPQPPAKDETAIHVAVQNVQDPVQQMNSQEKPLEVPPEIVPGLQAARKNAFEETSASPLKAEMESTIGSRYTPAETLYDRIGKSPQDTRLSEIFESNPRADLRISIGLPTEYQV